MAGMPSWFKAPLLSLKFRLTLVRLAARGLGTAVTSTSLVSRADEEVLLRPLHGAHKKPKGRALCGEA